MNPEENPYLKKHLAFPIQQEGDPSPGLYMVIVIPAYNEPEIITCLQSLWDCPRPENPVEVLVVLNSAENDEDEIVQQNQRTFWEVEQFQNAHRDEKLSFHVLNFQSLPSQMGGVGMARKLGMDESVFRLEKAGRQDGIILNLDADCTVREDYLSVIESWFINNPGNRAASIYFEHPLETVENNRLSEGIVRYELFLRYYMQGLRFAGYPFAWHTVGSCMATRSDIYQQQGGMNRRTAGEDFYFLHKLMRQGNFGQITSTVVYPSPRVSERVPFGTGRAMMEWMKKKNHDLLTYHPECFTDLKALLEKLPELTEVRDLNRFNDFITGLPKTAISFFSEENFFQHWQEMVANSSTPAFFLKRFYQWFNGLKVLQYIHHSRDSFYGEVVIEEASKKLLEMMEENVEVDKKTNNLLMVYRKIDKREYVAGMVAVSKSR